MENTKKITKINKSLIVATSICVVVIMALSIFLAGTLCKKNQLEIDLENLYQKNFIEFVDNVNNTDLKLGKAVNSTNNTYTQQLLNEISSNTAQASNNLAELPLSQNSANDMLIFINRVSGFASTMSKNLEKDKKISKEQTQTLWEIKQTFENIKNKINEMANDIYNKNIFEQSKQLENDINNFSLRFENFKAGDVDYPTMIFDGPFSESVANKKVVGLPDNVINKSQAKKQLYEIFDDMEGIECKYLGETKGKFHTFDFKVKSQKGEVFAQVTKQGGKLLTLCGYFEQSKTSLSKEQGIEKAISFAKKNKMDDMQVVWSEVVENDMYLNLAPNQNGVIVYPDLVKVKVDLATGYVMGFEACSYYTNHTERNFEKTIVNKDEILSLIPDKFDVKNSRLCIAPIEFMENVLCYEVMCEYNDVDYYFYIDCASLQTISILQVVESETGSLIM